MISPKKSLGQNFLIDKNIINKIIKLSEIKNMNIVEIGPGTGNLTKALIDEKPNKLTLIEKDKNLFNILNEEIEINKKCKIFNNDILDFDLEKNINENSIIYGNLPYNISTQILIKLIKFNWPPKYNKLILMFQKEVAEKILAKFNTSDYGRLSVISSYRLKIINYFHISKNCFFPKPKVDSTVLVFQAINKPLIAINEIKNLEEITRKLFSNKRKMINKSFKKIFKNYELISKKLNIDLKKRPSEISKKEYFNLTKYYENN